MGECSCCVCWCLSGTLFIFAVIVILCTGPVVYKHYNDAIGFLPARCRTKDFTPSWAIRLCKRGGRCNTIPCIQFRVSYDVAGPANSSVLLDSSQFTGYLNPDEGSIRETGWVRIKFNYIYRNSLPTNLVTSSSTFAFKRQIRKINLDKYLVFPTIYS